MSHRDARTDDVGATLSAPICIFGAGIAGITLARELSMRFDNILLIESGGLDYSDEAMDLYTAENIGLPYYDLTACRLRYFGGTGNHWAGYCRSNDPISYEARPDLGIPAWPISFEEMQPYVSRAAKLLGISDDFFNPAALLAPQNWGDAVEKTAAAQDFFLAVNQIADIDYIRFADRFGADIIASNRIHLVTDLSALELVASEDGGSIVAANCRTLTGKDVRVTSDCFVLACHTIENARLLLASNRQEPAGLGNGHDLVGRNFMEHPYINASILAVPDGFPEALVRSLANAQNRFVCLSLRPEIMQRESTLAYNCFFSTRIGNSEIGRALDRLRDGWDGTGQTLSDARAVVSDPGFLMGAVKDTLGWGEGMSFLVLEQMIEQSPNPESRVVLSPTERDALGQPRANLDWRLNDLDLHTFRTGQEFVVRELGALGLGRVRVEEITHELLAERVVGHYHHYGTTRMGETERTGVVDKNLRLFGKDNLSILGGSVFPGAGSHGPTMHIIAMAYRLADRLRDEYHG